MAKQPKLLDLVLERKPAAVMLSFGDPKPFVERIKRAGAIVICQVQSIALALEAVAAGTDIIVAQGTEAGGHGASRGLVTLVPEVIDAIGTEIPVVASGGRAYYTGSVFNADGALVSTLAQEHLMVVR